MNSPGKSPVWFLLTQHWLSLIGVALVATALISWLFVLPLHLRGHADNPYLGIVVFLVLPAVFFSGLLLIPVGVYQYGEGSFVGPTDARYFHANNATFSLRWAF